MRYRAFEGVGRAISAITLTLGPEVGPRDVRRLAEAAVQAGVNAFELLTPDARCASALGDALATVERELVRVILRLGYAGDPRRAGRTPRDFGRHATLGAIEQVLGAGGLGWLDLVVVDTPQADERPEAAFEVLDAERAGGRVHRIGVSGEGGAVDAAVATGSLEVLAAVYNLRSGWPQRHRINAAAEAGLVLLGERFMPDLAGPADAPAEAAGKLASLFKRRAGGGGGDAYAFLQRTPGWQADEICLAYALTEPALASVFVSPRHPEDLARLAETTERDLPAGVGAQIEMARFSAGPRART